LRHSQQTSLSTPFDGAPPSAERVESPLTPTLSPQAGRGEKRRPGATSPIQDDACGARLPGAAMFAPACPLLGAARDPLICIKSQTIVYVSCVCHGLEEKIPAASVLSGMPPGDGGRADRQPVVRIRYLPLLGLRNDHHDALGPHAQRGTRA